jgi:disulfide bond formation protein DsbB
MIDTRAALGLVLLASIAILGAAFAFQHLGGLQPCVLCIWQRYPYGVAIAVAVIGLLLSGRPSAMRAALVLCAAAFLVGGGIAAFHVGVEQGWWEGTASCGSTRPPSASIEELRARLMAAPVVRCDEVAWSLFGVSMAGYNVLLSIALAALALTAAARPSRVRPR